MSFMSEFKSFAMRGNVMDLAVGVVIGGAFGKIVTSLVTNIITPIIGVIIGGVKFDNLKLVLKESMIPGIPAVSIEYGLFLQSVIDFIIIAFAIFSVVKLMNSLKKKEEAKPAAPAAPAADIVLLTEIRDLLKK
ncbi:MAG: large-conductance mechanosensitive channel protein MscL [Bacteriovoracaceae bacterium]|nr:large-conductance mechanosensitive channel protein MscL [Bacteriovoracaceae bacterium]